MRYLTTRKFSSDSGYTEAAIRSKIAGGVWTENEVWRRAPGGAHLPFICSTSSYDPSLIKHKKLAG